MKKVTLLLALVCCSLVGCGSKIGSSVGSYQMFNHGSMIEVEYTDDEGETHEYITFHHTNGCSATHSPSCKYCK